MNGKPDWAMFTHFVQSFKGKNFNLIWPQFNAMVTNF